MPSHDEPSPSELEAARRHTRVPVDPVALGQPDGRHQRVDHSPGEVSDSYATQRYFLEVDGSRQLLTPDGQVPPADPGQAPNHHLLTAWNPGGRRRTYRENQVAQE